MNETTLLYALSTLAQTCAALVAFVGALGLYRLKSLDERRQDSEREFRSIYASQQGNPGWGQMVTTSDLIGMMRSHVRRFRDGQDPRLGEYRAQQIEKHLGQWESVGPDQRRTGRLLILFGGWNLGAILLALLGFNFLPYLKDRWWASWTLGTTATGAVLVTGFMILELLGSFPDWMDRLGLARLRTWLERDYVAASR